MKRFKITAKQKEWDEDLLRFFKYPITVRLYAESLFKAEENFLELMADESNLPRKHSDLNYSHITIKCITP